MKLNEIEKPVFFIFNCFENSVSEANIRDIFLFVAFWNEKVTKLALKPQVNKYEWIFSFFLRRSKTSDNEFVLSIHTQ